MDITLNDGRAVFLELDNIDKCIERYQDHFALSIEESVIAYIKTIDWDKEADGYQF